MIPYSTNTFRRGASYSANYDNRFGRPGLPPALTWAVARARNLSYLPLSSHFTETLAKMAAPHRRPWRLLTLMAWRRRSSS
jgi:hypothetical protein